MNPNTVKEERGYFNSRRAFGAPIFGASYAPDVVGAYRDCLQGCYDRHLDAIAHAEVLYYADRFDDGKHRDGKYDGDIRKGDFEAIRDNRHGDASEVESWAAGRLLARDQYDSYGDNRGWLDRNIGTVASVVSIGVCIWLSSGACAAGVIVALGVRVYSRHKAGVDVVSKENAIDTLTTTVLLGGGYLTSSSAYGAYDSAMIAATPAHVRIAGNTLPQSYDIGLRIAGALPSIAELTGEIAGK